jgi:alpha-ketoglutaric semialdehyde dehydrogenase
MMPKDAYRYATWLGGRWTGEGEEQFSTTDPADPAQVVGTYRASTEPEVGRVVEAARSAQREWARMPGLERQTLLKAYLDKLRAHIDPLARAMTWEMGKPLAEARGEVAYTLMEADFMVAQAAQPIGQVMPSRRRDMRNMSLRKPRGVVAAISPWNYPFLTPMRKIAPALVHGNAIVLKPSEFSPAAACMAAELAQGMLPEGLLGIVLGKAAVGQALVSHPLVNAVTFTGSVPTGRQVYAAAARTLAEVSLELGGKNPIVVHDAHDLDACLNDVVVGAMNNGGQRCTAISRVLVQRKLVPEVEAGLRTRMQALVVGNGFDEKTRIGPMAMQAQYEKVTGMIERGVAEGARVAVGGERYRPAGWESGYFVAPTLLCDVTPTMGVARNEIFGPVLSMLTYDTIEEAIAIVNDVDFGLSASLFSNDQRVVQCFIDQADAGMIHINNQTATDTNMPFVGVKDSGVGACSVGQSAANFYTVEHAIYLRYAA